MHEFGAIENTVGRFPRLSSTWLLGLDLGGGSMRCVALEAETGRTTLVARPFSGEADPEAPAGTRFDPAATRQELARLVAETMAASEAEPAAVRGIACARVSSSQ